MLYVVCVKYPFFLRLGPCLNHAHDALPPWAIITTMLNNATLCAQPPYKQLPRLPDPLSSSPPAPSFFLNILR